MKQKWINKYSVLIACAIAMLATGVHYVWSVFQGPVMSYFEINASGASLTFYLFIAFNVMGIIVGGRICDRIGPRIPVLIGILIYTAGLFASSFVPKESYWVMYVTYSGLVSFGGGFIYTCAISCAKKWWPEKQGFAGGFIVSMLGASTLVLTPLITALLNSPSIAFLHTFRILGTVFFVVLALVYGFMRFPENASEDAPARVHSRKTTLRILRSKSYYLLLICVAIGPFAFNTVNPMMKILGMQRGLSELIVGSLIMISGVASAAGRLLFGKLCDNIGSRNVLSILYVISFACILGLAFAKGAWFYLLIILLTCAYGGTAGISPMLAVDYYGSENTGTSFGMLMIAVLISSLLSPVIIGAIATPEGELTVWNFLIAAAFAVVGLIIARLNRTDGEIAARKAAETK